MSTVLQWFQIRDKIQASPDGCCLAQPAGLATLALHKQWTEEFGENAARQLWELVLSRKRLSGKSQAADPPPVAIVPKAPMADINKLAGG